MKVAWASAIGIFAVVASSAIVAPVQAAEPFNTISVGAFGGGGGGSSAVAGALEYERRMNDWLSLGLRVSGMSYDYEEDSYEEEGDGNGVDAAVRFYFMGEGLRGPNVTIHAGVWQTDWEWTDPTDSPRAGKGSSSTANLSASFGWRFLIGDTFAIQPSIMVGDFLANSEDDSGTNEQELGFYAAVGLTVGFAF